MVIGPAGQLVECRTKARSVEASKRYGMIEMLGIIIIFSPPAQSRRQENCTLDIQNYGCNGVCQS